MVVAATTTVSDQHIYLSTCDGAICVLADAPSWNRTELGVR
jgi:hypothetical protein